MSQNLPCVSSSEEYAENRSLPAYLTISFYLPGFENWDLERKPEVVLNRQQQQIGELAKTILLDLVTHLFLSACVYQKQACMHAWPIPFLALKSFLR